MPVAFGSSPFAISGRVVFTWRRRVGCRQGGHPETGPTDPRRGRAHPDAGEIERGTLDVTMSPPVARSEYLGSQMKGALLRIVFLAFALVVGNRIGRLYNRVRNQLAPLTLIKSAMNLALVGAAVNGYDLVFAIGDLVAGGPT